MLTRKSGHRSILLGAAIAAGGMTWQGCGSVVTTEIAGAASAGTTTGSESPTTTSTGGAGGMGTTTTSGGGACLGPVGWWKGDGDLLDAESTSDGFSGTQSGAVPVGFAPGHASTAFALNGQSYVEVPDAPGLHITAAITLEAWIFAGSLGGRIIDKITAGGVDGYLLDTNAGTLRLIIGNTWLTAPGSLPTGVWVHVASTWDGTTGNLYVDGVLVKSATLAAPLPSNTRALRLGADSNGNNRFDGLIDEAAVYDVALDPGQIATIAAASAPGPCGP